MNFKTKLSSLMYAPLALALLAACSSDDVLENNNEPTTQGQTLTIRATTEGGGVHAYLLTKVHTQQSGKNLICYTSMQVVLTR